MGSQYILHPCFFYLINSYTQEDCYSDAVNVLNKWYSEDKLEEARDFLEQFEVVCGKPSLEFLAIKNRILNSLNENHFSEEIYTENMKNIQFKMIKVEAGEISYTFWI